MFANLAAELFSQERFVLRNVATTYGVRASRVEFC